MPQQIKTYARYALLLVIAIASFGILYAKTQKNDFTVAIKKIDNGKAHFFTHKYKGTTIRFFIVKSTDGKYRAALDACDACFRAKKGYYQKGDYMVCRNCGRRFHTTRINVVSGGCNPVPLERTVTKKNILINIADIEAGLKYFK